MSDQYEDERRANAVRNQALFREINDRIDELSRRWASVVETGQYLCECLDIGCAEVIEGLTHDEYRQLRHDPAEFAVIPGHEQLDVEEVVDRNVRWLIVRKIGVGAEIAEQLAAELRGRARSVQHVA